MASRPSFDGTEDRAPDWADGEWGRPALSDHPEAEEGDDFEDLSDSDQDGVRSRFIEQEGENYSDLGYPVVNPQTENLNRNAVAAAKSRASASNDGDVEEIANSLWDEHFAEDEEDRAVSDVDLSPPASMVNAAQMGLRKKDELELGDCGTGSGETSARMIVNDEIAAGRMRKIAGYLKSHAEDWPDGETPSTISDEQLQDGCGPIQYLLWGGGTDTAFNWALRKANAVASEQGDTEPYDDSDFRSMSDDVEADSDEEQSARKYEGRSYQSRINDPEIRSTADGKVTVMIATDQIARDGMVLEPEGIDTSAYERNPVVLWEHGNHPDGGSVPIGRAPDLKEKSNGYLAEVEFDDDDDFASEIKRKVEDGFINAVSIGWHTENVKREERGGDMVPVVKEADMTEFSFVGVPADTEALVQSRMHYPDEAPPAETTFMCVCKGLIELEAARRSTGDPTYAQALQSVKDDIDTNVMGGMAEVKGPGCPFKDMPSPTDGFESLANVLNTEAEALMQAAAVDGCSYDRSTTNKDRGQRGGALADALEVAIADLAEDSENEPSDIEDQMAQNAGIDTTTVDDILNADIDCPPLDRLEAFAEVLNIDTEALVTAAEEDGCDYERSNDDEDTRDCGCGDEGTPSSPSASNGTPSDAERDDSPGTLIRLCQEIGATKVKRVADEIGKERVLRVAEKVGPERIARLYDERVDREAKKTLGVL